MLARALVPLALGAAGAGVAWFALSQRSGPVEAPTTPSRVRPVTVLDAAPSNTLLFAQLDLRQLRSHPLVAPLLGGDRAVDGLGTLRAACGFDPIERVDELALIVPPRGVDEVGLAAVGPVPAESLLACAERLVRARGGEPIRSSLGGFRTVRDVTSASAGEIAVRDESASAGSASQTTSRTLILVGAGPSLRSMIDAAEGTIPRLDASAEHRALRALVEPQTSLRATLVLSREQRDELASAASSAELPRGLAEVRGVSFGLRLEDARADAVIVAVTTDAASARSLSEAVAAARRRLSTVPAIELLGARPLLDRARIEVRDASVRVELAAELRELEDIARSALAARALLEGAAAPPGGAPSAVVSAAPASSLAPAPSSAPIPSGALGPR
jgi:hypothetical protein